MNEKTRYIYKIIFGAIIIVAAVFFSFRYLIKGPPLLKVLAVALVAGVIYLVYSYIKNTSRNH